jgi:hypothetical protein
MAILIFDIIYTNYLYMTDGSMTSDRIVQNGMLWDDLFWCYTVELCEPG